MIKLRQKIAYFNSVGHDMVNMRTNSFLYLSIINVRHET